MASRLRTFPFVLIAVLISAAILLPSATSHLAYIQNDVLAPFWLIDQAYHGEALVADRQQWLLPLTIGLGLKAFAVADRYSTLIHLSTACTAIFLSLTAIPMYFLALRFAGERAALVAVALLLTNAQFCISGLYLNPTVTFTFLVTAFFAILVWTPETPSPRRLFGLAAVAGLSVFVRHEGLILLALFFWIVCWHVRFRHLNTRIAIGAVGVAAAFALTNYGVRLLWANDGVGFLRNTGTTDTFFSLAKLGFRDAFRYLMAVLNYKAEMLIAFAVSLTLPLLLLVPLGAASSLQQRKSAGFLLLYIFLYESIVVAYLLVLPVSGYFLQSFTISHQIIDVHVVVRYYQVFTPILLLFATLGGLEVFSRFLTKSAVQVRKWTCIGLLALLTLFCLHQQFLLWNTYPVLFTDADPHAAEAVEAADWLRSKGIRKTEIAMFAPSLHPVHFAILSGNRVNCWGGQSDPNWNCERARGATTEQIVSGGDPFFSYVLLETSVGTKIDNKKYVPVFTSPQGRYQILQSIKAGVAAPH
jgi:hypothetical protein